MLGLARRREGHHPLGSLKCARRQGGNTECRSLSMHRAPSRQQAGPKVAATCRATATMGDDSIKGRLVAGAPPRLPHHLTSAVEAVHQDKKLCTILT